MDRPLPGTEKAFEDHLSSLLRIQIQAVLDEPAIPADQVRRFLEPFTWARVFSRIERVYQNLISPPRQGFLEAERLPPERLHLLLHFLLTLSVF